MLADARASRIHRTRRSTLLLVATASAALGLGAVEVATRMVVAPPEYIRGYPADPELGWKAVHRPGLFCSDLDGSFPFELSREGFRGSDLPDTPPPPGIERYLFVGDSFLFGWKVRLESLLPNSTAAALTERGIEIEPYNISCDGYGTAQELLLLRRHGRAVAPSVVVLSMFPGNDISDNGIELAGWTNSTGGPIRPYFVLQGGELRPTWLDPRAAWLRHSRIFQILERTRFVDAYGADGNYVVDGRPRTPEERVRLGLRPIEDLEILREPDPSSRWEQAWRVTEALLATMRDEVEALGARLFVVVIPHMWQVEANALFHSVDLTVRNAGESSLEELYDWNYPERRLGAFLDEQGIDHLELLPHLRRETLETGSSFYMYDGHLSSRGHALAGRLLGEALADVEQGRERGAEPCVGRPTPILAAIWNGRERLDFEHEILGSTISWGWNSWIRDASLGAGWLMSPEGWLIVPRDARGIQLECSLPVDADYPVTVSVHRGALVARRTVEQPGRFDFRFELEPGPRDRPGVPLLLKADRPFPFKGQRAGLLLHSLGRWEPGG